MARKELPDILGQLRQPVSVMDDILSGKPLGTWPKEVDYPVEKIIVGKRLRPVKDVTELAASMKEQGLLQRIVLLPDGTLVVGGHRVAAAKLLGWTTIPARIAELDEVDAELAEIDENLYRRELTVLEQAEHLQRRMELLEIKGQRAKAGDNQHSEATTTAAVAESIGISERSAQQRLQIARGLTQEARDALRDTELAESTTKLLELAKQPQEHQVKIVEKLLQSNESMSVSTAAYLVVPFVPTSNDDWRKDRQAKDKDARGGLTKAEYTKKLVPEIVEWLRSYKDVYGRTWKLIDDVAAHSNSRHWADITKEWKRRGIHFEEDTLKDAIKMALEQLKSEPETVGIEAPAASAPEPTISLNDLEVVDSVTVRVDDGGKLMMDWDDDDWAAYQRKLEQRQAANVVPSAATGSRQQGAQLATCSVCHRPLSDPASAIAGVGPCCAAKRTTAAGSNDAARDVLTPDRSEATSAAQKRDERIDSVLRRLYAAQAAASEFEELTGVYTHTPAFRRVMENMISVLEANRI